VHALEYFSIVMSSVMSYPVCFVEYIACCHQVIVPFKKKSKTFSEKEQRKISGHSSVQKENKKTL